MLLFLFIYARPSIYRRTFRFSPILLIFLLNLPFSHLPFLTLILGLRLFLYILALAELIKPAFRRGLVIGLFLSLVFQFSLGLLQVVGGGSLGQPFYWLGERSFSISTPNIARIEFWGSLFIRPYATFSHPNTFAGWFVGVVLALFYLRVSPRLLTFSWTLGALAILLSQSRSALIAYFLLLTPFLLLRARRKALLIVYGALLVLATAILSSLLFRTPTSFTSRLDLLIASLSIIKNYPIFGVGLGASLSAYPHLIPHLRLLQPDHNSFTLLASQLGLFGVLSLAWIARPFIIRRYLPVITILSPLLLLDHYLLTSTQGLVTLILVLLLAGSGHLHAKNKSY